MNYISLFDDFTNLDESYSFDSDSLIESKLNQMNSVRENCMAAWDFGQFSDFFSGFLNENLSESEKLQYLNEAYCTYELGILYENKSEWFSDNENIYYIDDASGNSEKIMLCKDYGIYMVSKETMESIKSGIVPPLNEGFLDYAGYLYDKAKEAGNKYIIEPVKKAGAWVKDKASKIWKGLTSGAKAVWNFCKKIVSSIAAFVKEDPIAAFGVLCAILGAVLGATGVGGPFGAAFTAIAGGIGIYSGGKDILKGTTLVGAADKAINVVKGMGKIVLGAAGLLLGIKDIITSGATAVPGAGAANLAVSRSAKAWCTKWVRNMEAGRGNKGLAGALGVSAWLGDFFATFCMKAPFMQKFLVKGPGGKMQLKPGMAGTTSASTQTTNVNVGKTTDVEDDKKKGKNKKLNAGLDSVDGYEINEQQEGGWSINDVIIPLISYIGRNCLSFLWKIITGALSGIGKIIDGVIDLPNKIVRGVDWFSKTMGSSFVGGLIAGSLKIFVKPAAKFLGKFVDAFIKPKIKPVTSWMIGLSKREAEIEKKYKSSPTLSKSLVEPLKDPGKMMLPKPKVKLEVSDKDKVALKKLGNKGDVALVKAGGGLTKMLEKIKKVQGEFKKKFPSVSKLKGSWGNSPSGRATFTYKNKKAGGYITLFNDGKYTVIDGPNQKSRGTFKDSNGIIKIDPPKGGFKKNEGRRYVLPITSFIK